MEQYYIKKISKNLPNSTPQDRALRLKRLRNMANLSRQQLCADEDLNIETYKGWELAKFGGLPLDGAKKVIRRIAKEGIICSIEWLLYEIGSSPYIVPDHLRNTTNSLFTMYSLDNEEILVLNEIQVFAQQYSETIYTKIPDNYNDIHYFPGDYVAGIKHIGSLLALYSCYCILQIKSGDIFVGKLFSVSENNYKLLSNNALSIVEFSDIEIEIIAPILRHYRICAIQKF